jgi:hypothetical protein
MFTIRGESPKDRTPDKNGFGAKCNGFQHIGSPSDSTVHQYRDAPSDGPYDGRKRFDRGRCGVELTATVV